MIAESNSLFMRVRAQRAAQAQWSRCTIQERLSIVRRFRHSLASECEKFAAAVNRHPAETLSSEVLPLAEACRFLEDNAPEILRPRRLSRKSRPLWLAGVDVEIRREAIGTVLVIGPYNYPLFLPGVHAVQALAAGNAVRVKPGLGGQPVMQLFARCFVSAGLDPALLDVLDEDPESGRCAIEERADKVIFTGSERTGLSVLSHLAKHGTPSVMELSGFDPVFVRPEADLDLVVRAVRFGLSFNTGRTCIAPAVVYARPEVAPELETRLHRAGVTIPVTSASDEEALALAAESGFALGASVFGKHQEACEFARHIRAGVVVVNDMIVPTADPRVPFGGLGRSGFGITRGAEGLLEMTSVRAVISRKGRWRPHFNQPHGADAGLFAHWIRFSHGDSLRERTGELIGLIRGALRRGGRK